MPRLAANLSFLFNELPFLERFAAAAAAGFKAVEFFSPYEFPPEELARLLARHALTLALFNIRIGAPQNEERGLAAHPGQEEEFDRRIAQALDYARHLGRPGIHVLAGTMPDGVSRERCHEVFTRNLRRASGQAASAGVTLMIEPLNALDNPGYALRTTAEAVAILQDVDHPNVRLQLDLYHLQISEGDLARRIEALMPWVGHVQIAGNPGRNEPSCGEVNFPFLLETLDRLGYGGWVGCEYRPAAGTWEGLDWARPYGVSRTLP